MHQADIKHFCRRYQFGLAKLRGAWDAVSVALPVHCDLPVQLTREGDPGDGARVVVGVNSSKGHHTATVTVTMEKSVKLLKNVLEISCYLCISK